MPVDNPKIGIVSIMLECNAFCPVTTGEDFRNSCYIAGDEILEEARKETPAMPLEIPGFMRRMDRFGPWTPVPTVCTYVEPGGPVEESFFKEFLAEVRQRLEAAMPLDGVYICNHGAMAATHSDDPDGELYAMVRDIIGPDKPLIVTIDLHANISERMVETADVIVSYRTNPHVDRVERSEDAAKLMRELLAGRRFDKVFLRMPITAPTVRLLTGGKGTYAEAIRGAEAALAADDRIASASVVGSFVFADLRKNGMSILVYGDRATGEALADRLARQIWENREDFLVELTPLDEAVRLAVQAASVPGARKVCLADVADNPGTGGSGNTTDILLGLLEAGAQNVCLGLFRDAELAAACHEAGVGARFEATFNRSTSNPFAKTFERKIEVLSLTDGWVVGRHGARAGRKVKLGPSAAIKVDGITVVLSSRRMQLYDPAYLEQHGLDVASFATVVVKSRGHFRAGFDIFFEDDQIYEVDASGLASPVLSRWSFKGLPRPTYPLDPDTRWTSPFSA